MCTEKNPAGQEAPSHHRPAACDVNPLLAGIFHDQRAKSEGERHRETYISQVKHRRVYHHLGILKQRIKPISIRWNAAAH